MSEPAPIRRDVLLVDDDDATRRLFELVLARAGLTVVTARDGVDALTVLATHAVDTIVLDLMMPRMSGFEVLDRLTRERAELIPRAIILSAASLQWMEKAGRYPVFAVLRKPVDLDELLQSVLDCVVQDARGTRKAAKAVPPPPATVRAAG